jgi:2-dehydropantoate 2-reductase
MRTAILGCGAMGTVIGAFLTKNGLDVELIDAYEAHVDALNKNGARIIGTVELSVPVKAILPSQMKGIYDVVILLTKQTVTKSAVDELLPHLDENSTVLTMQNGVPEPYLASLIGEKRTVGGTLLWGATFIGPGVSEVTQNLERNDHLFEIGEIDGSIGARIQKVAEILGYMGKVHISDSLMVSRWGKLVNNACMSGMSAVCGSTYGEVINNQYACACLSYIGSEVKACCEAAGYKLPILLHDQLPDSLAISDRDMFEANQASFKAMYSDMHAGKASMLQDLEKGKMTEVKMINGFVCEQGDKLGIDTPFNDTVVEIITKIEKGELPLSMENISHFKPELFKYKV